MGGAAVGCGVLRGGLRVVAVRSNGLFVCCWYGQCACSRSLLVPRSSSYECAVAAGRRRGGRVRRCGALRGGCGCCCGLPVGARLFCLGGSAFLLLTFRHQTPLQRFPTADARDLRGGWCVWLGGAAVGCGVLRGGPRVVAVGTAGARLFCLGGSVAVCCWLLAVGVLWPRGCARWARGICLC